MGPQGPSWRGALCFLRQQLINETQMKNVWKLVVVAVLLLAIVVLGVVVWSKRPAVALRGKWVEATGKTTLEFYKDGTLVMGNGNKEDTTHYRLIDTQALEIGSRVYKFQIQDDTLVFTSGDWEYRKFAKKL